METTEPKSSENDITRDDSDQKERLIELKNEYKDQLPVHVGFIPDGNRRWSRKTGVHRNVGHYRGYEVVKKILVACHHAGIKYLSLYALSLENALKRPADELAYIHKLLKIAVDQVKKEKIVTENKVKFRVLGRIELLPQDVRDKIDELVEYTKDFNGPIVNVLIMYDGQAEIVDAMKNLISDNVNPEKIDRSLVKKYLYSKDSPPVDFIVRCGMEDGARISGFLLWDSSYAEFKFREEYWPEYSIDLLIEDLKDFVNRNRRKGK